MKSDEKFGGFICVHVGAGYHSVNNEVVYKNICKDACNEAIEALRSGKSSLEAVKSAICILENSSETNAGYGSNLTIEGTVECDASIMDGTSLYFGAVGAVQGIKNPILIAEDLVKNQKGGNMSLGRIPPSILVGDGAAKWAKMRDITMTTTDGLITSKSQGTYMKHKQKLLRYDSKSAKRKGSSLDDSTSPLPKYRSLDSSIGNGSDDSFSNYADVSSDANLSKDQLFDTVGAIAVDHLGHISSAVSSGGIVLKQCGRLGQACIYGCGCWAENYSDKGIGVSTSGCGEHLIKTMLAQKTAESLKSHENKTDAVMKLISDQFLNSPYLKDIDQKLGGVLALYHDKTDENNVELIWAHSTDSMCIGFMSSEDKSPKSLITRLPEGVKCGYSYVLQSEMGKF